MKKRLQNSIRMKLYQEFTEDRKQNFPTLTQFLHNDYRR